MSVAMPEFIRRERSVQECRRMYRHAADLKFRFWGFGTIRYNQSGADYKGLLSVGPIQASQFQFNILECLIFVDV